VPKIKVHEKALAHLTRGLYRSPASALRELVSNAWDANATEVTIDCNYPHFYQISVQDNGEGFSEEEFDQIMSGGVGNSDKRTQHPPLKFGREIIGRLGIGMLGIAQICGSFTVSSRPKKGKAFRARVHLYDLLKQRLDDDDPDIVNVKTTEVDVGEYKFEDVDPDEIPEGTTIIADDVHPTFTRSFQQSLTYDDFLEPELNWKKNLKIISGVHSLQQLGDYWRLLWELSASIPVPYIDETALPGGLIKKEQTRLEKANFRVVVDGIPLFKPVYLRGNEAGYTTVRVGPSKETVYGNKLAFTGYIAVQEGTQLRPDELRGILIRIKDIGIGYYDPSLLDYRYNQGPRSRWVTGEIFVREGLENALNVDRDSFNRFHPEFRVLQAHVHKLLEDQVFPKVYKNIEVRSLEKADARYEARESTLQDTIAEVLERDVELVRSDNVEEPTASVKSGTKRLLVSLPEPEAIPTKKSNRQLASALLALFEVASLQGGGTRQRDTFRKLVLKLLTPGMRFLVSPTSSVVVRDAYAASARAIFETDAMLVSERTVNEHKSALTKSLGFIKARRKKYYPLA
jgi:hypothetical protein